MSVLFWIGKSSFIVFLCYRFHLEFGLMFKGTFLGIWVSIRRKWHFLWSMQDVTKVLIQGISMWHELTMASFHVNRTHQLPCYPAVLSSNADNSFIGEIPVTCPYFKILQCKGKHIFINIQFHRIPKRKTDWSSGQSLRNMSKFIQLTV